MQDEQDTDQSFVLTGDKPVVVRGKSGSKFLIFIIFIAVICLVFAGGLLFSKKAYLIWPQLFPEPVGIPLAYNDPSVYRASFVYAFRTKVVGLEEKDGQTVLKTELTGIDNLPEFVIDNDTVIVLVQNSIEFKTTKDILKLGVPIYIYLAYNLNTKQWSTTRIAKVSSR